MRLRSDSLAAAKWRWLAAGWSALVAGRWALTARQLDLKSYFYVVFLCARQLQLFAGQVAALADQKRVESRWREMLLGSLLHFLRGQDFDFASG